MTTNQKIEAILFAKGEPLTVKKLASFLNITTEEIEQGIIELSNSLENRAPSILRREDEITLGTKPEVSDLVESIYREELNKELSKASIETISVILYRNGATRADIDYIRGVNSSFILRNLLIRGLVAKAPHSTDSRKFLYKPTFETMSFLGIQNISELPDYEKTNQILLAKEAELKEIEK